MAHSLQWRHLMQNMVFLLLPLSLPVLLPLPLSPGAMAALPQAELPKLPVANLKTDLTRHNIPLAELLGGCPSKDCIPAINQPKFVDIKSASGWLASREPVLVLTLGGAARAYPLQILMWHEIVNDTIGAMPVVVTYCPLCNTALAFNPIVKGRVLKFGVSGLLRNSDLVMYDRETESLWQQATGEGIVGEFTNVNLDFLPAQVLPFGQFTRTHPEGLVLSRDTGFEREYGKNPYVGYDASSKPRLFKGKLNPRLPPMERLATVSLGGKDKAYPFSLLAKVGMVQDQVGDTDVVVFFTPGMASAVDQKNIGESRDVGSTGVFVPMAGNRKLHFRFVDGHIQDEETHSRWDITGQAVEGILKGESLKPLPHGTHFAFAWLAFKPKTILFTLPR